MRILVIEDEATSLKLANRVLSSEGHQVVDATSAEAAIIGISESQPEIILLDLALPGMNDYALIRKLKNDPKTPGIPVIAVTAYPNRFPRNEACTAGCEAYIVKPIDTRKLASQVAAVAEKHQA